MLLQRLNEDLKVAMKARDGVRVAVLRLILSQCKNARIEKRDELDDGEVIAVIKRGVKSRGESVEMYRQGGRDDLAATESAEIEILKAYLPEQLGGEALSTAIDAIIEETGATSMQEMGVVMKAVMARHRESVDGKEVQSIVRSRLSG